MDTVLRNWIRSAVVALRGLDEPDHVALQGAWHRRWQAHPVGSAAIAWANGLQEVICEVCYGSGLVIDDDGNRWDCYGCDSTGVRWVAREVE